MQTECISKVCFDYAEAQPIFVLFFWSKDITKNGMKGRVNGGSFRKRMRNALRVNQIRPRRTAGRLFLALINTCMLAPSGRNAYF